MRTYGSGINLPARFLFYSPQVLDVLTAQKIAFRPKFRVFRGDLVVFLGFDVIV